MRPSEYTTVSYSIRLRDTQGQPVVNLPFVMQYLDPSTQQWTDFHRDFIRQGAFFFEEPITPPDPEIPKSIFLQTDLIPELRLVAFPSLYNSTKPEVIAFTCQLTADPNAGTLAFYFGTLRLVDEEALPSGDFFNDFIVITSLHTLTGDQELIEELQEQVAELTLEIQVKDATIASLNTQLVSALSQLELKTLQVTRLETIKGELEANILQLQGQVELLQGQLDIDSRPVLVSDLYSQLVQEIDTSTQNNVDAGYKLANISLKLKTLITRDENGVSAQLFDLSAMDQINGAAVSELTFDIAPATTPAPQTNTVPNLLGLTETAVRKILASLGLRLNPVFQNNTQVVDGDSFKQTPAAGTEYSTNDFVTVIFSKHE